MKKGKRIFPKENTWLSVKLRGDEVKWLRLMCKVLAERATNKSAKKTVTSLHFHLQDRYLRKCLPPDYTV